MTCAAVCGAVFAPFALLRAQGPVTRTLQRMEERAEHNITEAAEDMPADRYAFKPTPEQRTFAELVVHVAEINVLLCNAIAARPVPVLQPLLATKDKLEKPLDDSFDLCNSVLEHADDSFLEDSVAFVDGHRVTRARALIELAVDWADHYAQMAMYLRLNGVLPPTVKHKEKE
jgi:hypothetical protein